MNRISGKKKVALLVLLHVVCWAVFLSLPAVFNPRRHSISIGGFIDDILEPPRWRNGVLLIAVFYFNYYVTFPWLYLRQRYVLLFISFITCFAAFFLLNYSMMPHGLDGPPMPPIPPDMPHHPHGGFNALGISFNLFMFIIVYAASYALSMYELWQKTKEEKLHAEISFLKAQVNPHFLFNTLNSIYSLTLTKSDKAPDAVIKLSGMMRYFVSEANQSYVSMSKELAYINDYIEMQKLRLTDKIKLRYEVSGDEDDKRIAPFLLIPFIENAFKYGVNSDENSDILIKIQIHDKDLHLYVYNVKVYIRPDMDKGTGLGINSTRQRLNLLYPGRHKLTVTNGEKDFAVSLNVTFQ